MFKQPYDLILSKFVYVLTKIPWNIVDSGKLKKKKLVDIELFIVRHHLTNSQHSSFAAIIFFVTQKIDLFAFAWVSFLNIVQK